MGFFKNLFGGQGDKSPREPTPNGVLKAIKFAKPESKLVLDDAQAICYISQENVAYMLRLNETPDWDFDLRTLYSAYHFYNNQCSGAKGAMMFLDVAKADDAEVLRGIFKYRSAKNPLAIMYVGIIWVPFMECCLQINIEAVEQGTTGVREALVSDLMMAKGTFEMEESFEPAVKVESVEEMFKLIGEKPLKVIPSDDDQWDEKFPNHPLSLVRKHLRTVTQTLQLEPSMHALTPFRIA